MLLEGPTITVLRFFDKTHTACVSSFDKIVQVDC